MKMPPSSVPENKYSRLLTNEENLQVFKLLGNRCQSLSTTVVQLFCTDPPYHAQWLKKDTGVLCFAKDNVRKNYFFRMFCLKRNGIVWEQELYNNMEYTESTIFLHIFEGEDTIVAFNFADTDEAREFKYIVDEKLTVRRRREEKRARQPKEPVTPKIIVGQDPVDYKKTVDPVAKLAKRKRNITKADIGSPLDFKHISHVGWNPDSGFDINSEDDQLKCFFEKAGISEKQLEDQDTKEFIYDFINRNGGREAIKKATTRNSERRAPAAPPFNAVPPVPPRGAPRPPHVRTAPPPPPPIGNHVKTPSVVSNNSYMDNERPAPPPPPPPIPVFEAPCSPPPPPPPMVMPSENARTVAPTPPSLNSALMESIKSGTTLKHVEERKVTPVDEPRTDLLSEIRKGITLKPVNERDVRPVNNVPEPGSGNLAEALARALAERSKAIHSEDDDDEDDSNDDEWED